MTSHLLQRGGNPPPPRGYAPSLI